MPSWRIPLIGALVLTMGLAPMQAVTAAPASTLPAAANAEAGSAVLQARYRSHGHRGHWGRGVGIGIGLGILGGIIASEAYAPPPGYYYEDYDGPYYAPQGYSGDPRRLCAQNFRSFEWSTGMYTTYSGERRLCPYLR